MKESELRIRYAENYLRAYCAAIQGAAVFLADCSESSFDDVLNTIDQNADCIAEKVAVRIDQWLEKED